MFMYTSVSASCPQTFIDWAVIHTHLMPCQTLPQSLQQTWLQEHRYVLHLNTTCTALCLPNYIFYYLIAFICFFSHLLIIIVQIYLCILLVFFFLSPLPNLGAKTTVQTYPALLVTYYTTCSLCSKQSLCNNYFHSMTSNAQHNTMISFGSQTAKCWCPKIIADKCDVQLAGRVTLSTIRAIQFVNGNYTKNCIKLLT